ncbi:hypothetical protein [Wolbachia endosymbiont (group A) of Agelastica alni]|uniref:hypothetical protein n=1 Tax=Wolbachia endosymbiont (group A) of Agelastica alni TaxID=3066130 RepID=UPI003132B13F
MTINKKGIQVIYMDAECNIITENTYGYECIETVQSVMVDERSNNFNKNYPLSHYIRAIKR